MVLNAFGYLGKPDAVKIETFSQYVRIWIIGLL